jgi:hypothetical protein
LFLWLLLFLAPPLPIAVYLLLLGALNRARHAVLVSGTWDFAGVLFAASGFLLCGGPAVLSLLNDRWRESWLVSQAGDHAPTSPGSLFWLLLFFVYYVLILVCAAFLIRRQRRLTAVYNALPQTVESALAQAFDRLGLHPSRTGPLYLFDPPPDAAAEAKRHQSEAIQAPYLPSPASRAETLQRPLTGHPQWTGKATGRAVLEIEAFPAMKHVTLRWDPAEALLREEVEKELAQRLAECPAPRNEMGAWLTVLGLAILGITLLGGCAGVFLMLALH